MNPNDPYNRYPAPYRSQPNNYPMPNRAQPHNGYPAPYRPQPAYGGTYGNYGGQPVEVKSEFKGSVWGYIGLCITNFLLVFFTLLIALPWAQCRVYRWDL
jgi:hypothetical protein